VNQQENDADYQPDDWEGVEDALEERFQFSVPGLVTRFTLRIRRRSVFSHMAILRLLSQ
jgi:hypothetical protein